MVERSFVMVRMAKGGGGALHLLWRRGGGYFMPARRVSHAKIDDIAGDLSWLGFEAESLVVAR